MKKRIVSAVMAAVLSLSLFSGCTLRPTADNLIDGISRDAIAVQNQFENGEAEAVSQFAAKLLQQSYSGEGSIVISPISILYALVMTANGADGETLAQMEQLFDLDIETLNQYLYSTVSVLPSDEGYTVDMANSVWVNDDEDKFEVNEEFLKTVKNYYDAGVFKEYFDDATLKAINNWVEQKTNGQIENVLDKIDEDAVMYLVNAINFEADWQNDYIESQVRTMTFNNAEGEAQETEFMFGDEYTYLEDNDTTGFIKYYKDREYAFVALLPNENISIDEYIAALSGEKITNLLQNADNKTVETAMPKFETSFDIEMRQALENLGMTDAFDYRVADFSRMGKAQEEGANLCINRVIHKAFICVAEKGTQAGAATVVEMVTESAAEMVEKPKTVWLDRPFVYMVIDCQNNLPLFMGAVTEFA